jgi:catechol 2,3-dioxygenase-like lactoylglutathione lyase family enzyme
MKPAGVHHVAICVADAQKGLAFYRDVLGMTQPVNLQVSLRL